MRGSTTSTHGLRIHARESTLAARTAVCNALDIMALHHDFAGAPPLLQYLYRAFQQDPVLATFEARLRFRELTPDIEGFARSRLAELQGWAQGAAEQARMAAEQARMAAAERRVQEAANRASAETTSSYNATLASIGATPSLTSSTSSVGGGLLTGGLLLEAARLLAPHFDLRDLPQFYFVMTVVEIAGAHGDPAPDTDLRIRTSAIDVVMGRASIEDFAGCLGAGAANVRAQAAELGQILSYNTGVWHMWRGMKDLARWTTRESFRIAAALLVPRGVLYELFARLQPRNGNALWIGAVSAIADAQAIVAHDASEAANRLLAAVRLAADAAAPPQLGQHVAVASAPLFAAIEAAAADRPDRDTVHRKLQIARDLVAAGTQAPSAPAATPATSPPPAAHP